MKNIFKLNYLLFAVMTLFVFTACEEDEAAPEEENEVEVFTDVKLVFTPAGGGASVEAAAQDPDGAGVQELQVLGSIDLAANTAYTLTMVIENCLESPCELDERGDRGGSCRASVLFCIYRRCFHKSNRKWKYR